jgi:hypothetical protein
MTVEQAETQLRVVVPIEEEDIVLKEKFLHEKSGSSRFSQQLTTCFYSDPAEPSAHPLIQFKINQSMPASPLSLLFRSSNYSCVDNCTILTGILEF